MSVNNVTINLKAPVKIVGGGFLLSEITVEKFSTSASL